ncbi:hypothetical protein ABTL56_19325, partial [Acinetobacter baumannii]
MSLVGLVGDDAEADALGRLIEAEPGVAGHIVAERDRRTTVKTRFVAAGQQLLRLDSEQSTPPGKRAARGLIEAVEDAAAEGRAI